MKNMQLRGTFLAIITAVAAGVSSQAQNLVVNGGFEALSNGSDKQLNTGSTGSNYTVATPWNATYISGSQWINQEAYIVVGNSTSLSETGGGAANSFGPNFRFWGSIPSSPSGGNFIASEADWGTIKASLSQTVSGLEIGTEYNVTFDWAAGQQVGYDGPTSTRWDVTFAGLTKSTDYANVPNHGFSGWSTTTLKFIASNTSEVLSFIAYSPNGGLPPFALLDGVSVTPVPEPSAFAAVAGGLLVLVGVARRRAAK